ncbi:hypothetical protein I3843_14G001700 [Carya illinoinensis]|nr:hypothetical protein I3843_14G001700 [Carya illinoinensis]
MALPASLAVAADPIASLIDTAFIGHIGSVELAAAGVSIALFNQASRITIFPLVSITTSFVAEEDTVGRDMESGEAGKKGQNLEKSLPKDSEMKDASTTLLFGAILGVFPAIVLILGAKPLLHVMGSSPMLAPALKDLKLRSLGAPAVLLSLAMQGIFRGFKDTKTPLYVIVVGYTINIILDPILIFVLCLGISCAAIAHVLSQYLILSILLCMLVRKVYLLPPSGLLLARVVTVTFCVTLAASLAARLGSMPMAAFQTCLQVWLTSSLLSDGLAVAGQAILACAFAEKDYKKATACYCKQGITDRLDAQHFSRDVHFLHLIVAAARITSLFILYKSEGFLGIWIALTIYMFLRTFIGIWR